MKIYADKDSPRANGEGWHTDVSCDVEPPMGSILYIRQCPPRGGDTLFASMYAAYESLSERMKTYIDGLAALHDGKTTYRGIYADARVAHNPSSHRHRVLGQPRGQLPRYGGLVAAHARRHPRDGQGGKAGVT
jgi:taurine dioxygenase